MTKEFLKEKAIPAKTEEQLIQEDNLMFIGITRSQSSLYYVMKDRDER